MVLFSCMEFYPHLCLQRSKPELNINLSLFITLFQVQCNMEHEWLPEESLAGTLANLFLAIRHYNCFKVADKVFF